MLPFLDISKLKSMFNMSSKLTEYMTLNENEINSDGWCGICGTTQICMPYVTQECKHIFCYYCIQRERQKNEEGLKCPKC